MNILNTTHFLQKGQFSYFKIRVGGDEIPTGFKAYNLPEGMELFKTDGWIYGVPTKEESNKAILLAESTNSNTYKYVDMIVKDFTFFREYKNQLRRSQIKEDVDISKITNFDENTYFKNLEVNDTVNFLPVNITGFRYATGQNIGIVNLDLILSGFYKNTGFSGYGGWWADNCENPPWCDGITSGLNELTFLNNSSSANFIFELINKTGLTKITGWGNNTDGRAINGNKITGAILISAGNDHALSLLDGFVLTGWGNNAHGKIYGTTNLLNINDTPMRKLTGVAGISAGSGHSLALLFDRKITGWGLNTNGQVSGDILGGNWSTTPVGILTGVRQVSAGGTHSLALLANRKVTGWGDNTFDKALGGNNLTGIIQISAGDEHSLALLNTYRVTGWGRNNYGQVFGSSLYTSWENSPISNLTGIVKIDAGAYHSLALLSNGLVTGWGLNNYGQAETFCYVAAPTNPGGTGVPEPCVGNAPLCPSPLSYLAIIGYDNNNCPIYTCISCPNASFSCGGYPFPDAIITSLDSNGCPNYKCPCNQGVTCTANDQDIASFYERQDGLGTLNLILSPISLGWIFNTTQIIWGDLIPLNQSLTENLPSSYWDTLDAWVTSHTFLSETPTNIIGENILVDFDAQGCPVFLCRFTVTVNEGRGINLKQYLNYDISSIGNLDLIFRFEGNTGAKAKPDAGPAIDTGDWPAGTTLKIINGPVIGGGCNPTAGVIAGRGDGYCGAGPKGTAAIHVRAGIHLIIVNDGKIGGGGGVGGDTGGPCGEGGPGAGIPAGTHNGGGGGNTCCGGEGPASVLCGGNGGGGSGSGGNLGNRGGCGSYCTNNANPAILLGAGASFAFDAISSRPFFEGEAIVGSL